MATRPTIVLIAAVSDNGVIGRDGDMPWHLPADLKHFKRVTMGHPVLMGRRTWESIGRPLPGRSNIVLTRDLSYRAEGATVVHSLDDSFAAAEGDVLMVIGGGEIYRAVFDAAAVIELTRVHADIDGDTTFPPLPEGAWSCVSREHHDADSRHAHAFTFERWERVPIGH
ncbi:MAG: dihydrofolate reductase [Phycisphaerales bacterium]|jgi:dihydrofolate reductase|nr:dihydrofolate reductase [Phycisphaerales bacterium]